MLLIRASAWRFRSVAAWIGIALAASAACASTVSTQPWPAVKPAGSDPAGIASAAAATPISGFRKARFGMSEPELLGAVRHDFPAAAARLMRFTQASERTTVLAVTVADLLPGAGPARISYILGYSSKRLIQVNIVWSGDGRTTARDEAIVAAANTLRDHFETQYPAPLNAVITNQPIGENAILVFRAAQANGRMIVLLLSGVAAAARRAQTLTRPPLALQLCYIRDHQHPDIFHIEPGRF